MTAAQRRLARHALGLSNRARQSYRNYYVVGYCPGSYDLWVAMVDAGVGAARDWPRFSGGRYEACAP